MIEVEGLVKQFKQGRDPVRAVDGVSFTVGQGEIVTLLGPSGCGKTTTLRAIAGLERADGGRISIGGTTVVDVEKGMFVAPQRRNLGMVFQSYAIWPHMNVLENVAYALEGRGLPRAVMREQAMRALDTVQLGHLADRPAPRLSGGQQQRVAIARAIVSNPQALLFDEPLSNLDARLRAEMRNELKRLQRGVGLTSVYVTHDQAEALALSDWIIVMKDGRIIEHGRPVDIYRHPRNVFTAQFVGQTNLIDGTVVSRNQASRGVLIETAVGRIAGTDPDGSLPEGAKVKLSVRPEDIAASDTAEAPPASDGAYNVVRGHLRFAVFAGSVIEAEVDCAGTIITCFLGRDADMTIGRSVTLAMAPRTCLALPDA